MLGKVQPHQGRGAGWRGGRGADQDVGAVGRRGGQRVDQLAHGAQLRLHVGPQGLGAASGGDDGGGAVHHLDELLAVLLGGGRRPLHEQVPGHQVQEDPAHPVGHAVGPRRAVVDVQHEHGDDDGERDEDHGEEEVLADERDDQRRGGDDLGDEQQEDGEGQQHGDAQRDLLAALRGQVEDQHREARDEQAGDDEVDGVEERQPADDEVVRDVGGRSRCSTRTSWCCTCPRR